MPKKILLIPSGIGRSHATRLRLIADVLTQGGYDIACVCTPAQRDLFANYRHFPTTDVDVTDFNINVFAQYDLELIEQCVRDEMHAIEAFAPDLLVTDMRLTAAVSARAARLPLVSLVNASLTRHFNPTEALAGDDKRNWKAIVMSAVVQDRQMRESADLFKRVARQFKLRKLVSLADFVEGDLTLMPDLPQFCPTRRMEKGYHYVGPIIWEGDSAEAPLPAIDTSRQLIYATIGNTGSPKLVEALIEIFQDETDYQLVITTGAYIVAPSYMLPPHMSVTPFIPGSHVLPHAAAVIHVGGSGTTYQAIRHGVPALIVPYNNEQRINGRLVQKLGLGQHLSPKTDLPRHLIARA